MLNINLETLFVGTSNLLFNGETILLPESVSFDDFNYTIKLIIEIPKTDTFIPKLQDEIDRTASLVGYKTGTFGIRFVSFGSIAYDFIFKEVEISTRKTKPFQLEVDIKFRPQFFEIINRGFVTC